MTKKERKEYNHQYKELKDKNSKIDKYTIADIVVKPSQFNFKGSGDVCCSEFGCGRLLTNEEKMYGTKCINHSKNKNVDAMDFIKPPYFKKAV